MSGGVRGEEGKASRHQGIEASREKSGGARGDAEQAEAMLLILQSREAGLIRGGPEIDGAACERVLRDARRRGWRARTYAAIEHEIGRRQTKVVTNGERRGERGGASGGGDGGVGRGGPGDGE